MSPCIIEHFRGNEAIKEKIESLTEEDRLGLTWLTLYEFFKGIFVSGKLGEEKFLEKLVETCIILETSYEAAKIAGEIYAGLRKLGKLINDADILIGGIVKAHDAVLVMNNDDHFSRIEGLKLENWLS